MSHIWKTAFNGGVAGLSFGVILGLTYGFQKKTNPSYSSDLETEFGIRTMYIHHLSDELDLLKRFVKYQQSEPEFFISLVRNMDRLIGLYQLALFKKGTRSFTYKASRYCWKIEKILNYFRSICPENLSDFEEDVALLQKHCQNYKFNIYQEMAGQMVHKI